MLLFRQNFRWISVVQAQVKFFNLLERALKDNFKYVQCCLICLGDGLADIVPLVFQAVAESLQQHLSHGGCGPNKLNQEFEEFCAPECRDQVRRGGNLFWVSALVDLITNQFLRNKVFTANFVRALACLLDNLSLLVGQADADPALAFEFQNQLLVLVESLANNGKVLLTLHDPVVKSLLPVLIAKVGTHSEDLLLSSDLAVTASESRFLCLKILTDMLIQLLNEDAVYSPQKPNTETQSLDSLLVQVLIPLASSLLQENEPAPFYGQRLLASLLDCNIRLLKHVGQGTILAICDCYQTEDSGASLNKHTIKIMRHMLQIFSFETIHNKQIVRKTLSLMSQMLKQRQEWFLELLLDINQTILQRLSEAIKQANAPPYSLQLVDQVYAGFDLCVSLLANDNTGQINV